MGIWYVNFCLVSVITPTLPQPRIPCGEQTLCCAVTVLQNPLVTAITGTAHIAVSSFVLKIFCDCTYEAKHHSADLSWIGIDDSGGNARVRKIQMTKHILESGSPRSKEKFGKIGAQRF